MTIKVYCKAVADLTTKVGTYAYIFVAPGERESQTRIFKSKIKTLTQADCAAYTNALHYLSRFNVSEQITKLEIITDSGKVADLLSVYKAEKHCEEIARYWREQIKPIFKNAEIEIIKVKAKDASTLNGKELRDCELYAHREMRTQRDLLS